jgi:hypothetical protein
MRLKVPVEIVSVETASVSIVNGPGATRLLDAALELIGIGGYAYADHPGPKLEFTVESPVDGKPVKQTVEMSANFVKFGGHYEFYGLIAGNPNTVHVVYWLKDSNEPGRGSIKDLVL